MQKLSIKVSEQFYNKLSCSKLTPIRVTPLVGYQFKHHFIVTFTCESNFIINGAVTKKRRKAPDFSHGDIRRKLA